jgi:hypothetical protein
MADFDHVIHYVGLHPYFAFLAVLFLALSEAIPVIGTVVPGSTLILRSALWRPPPMSILGFWLWLPQSEPFLGMDYLIG